MQDIDAMWEEHLARCVDPFYGMSGEEFDRLKEEEHQARLTQESQFAGIPADTLAEIEALARDFDLRICPDW